MTTRATTSPHHPLPVAALVAAALLVSVATLAGVLLPGCLLAQSGPRDVESTRRLFERYERECLAGGWRRVNVEVGGRERMFLWKGPDVWTRGAIVALHGGGGHASNFGANIRLGRPMVDFSAMAIEAGFAVFCPDSTWGVVTDARGRDCGKRWDCVAGLDRANVDLPFLEAMFDAHVPARRPDGSADDVFLTGISNGGFMTILAAAHFPDKIRAFAPVSAGDPFGTHMDMGTHPAVERPTAPGVFRDNETRRPISEPGAADSTSLEREAPWPDHGDDPDLTRAPFKQFQSSGDGVLDVSLMRKARAQLVGHGFRDAGALVLDEADERSALRHFWRGRYNRPLIEFFSDPDR